MEHKQYIEHLANARSATGGTSLITLYMLGNTNVWLGTSKLNQEMSAASNIKSKQVRKDVKAALRSSLHLLKTYKGGKTPANGLILCAGNMKSWV